MTATASAQDKKAGSPLLVVAGSTLGTMFEWYDFFLYGALAAQIAAHFFSGVNETTGFIFALAGFAVGFLVRPLGALIFGGIGDRVGRKNTFLVTLAIMGLATVLIGLIPKYDVIGLAAPIALIALRVLQGLAIGGEFGGAVTYVSEHAPEGRRGLYTAFLPASAVVGLLLSLLVIAGVRAWLGADAFEDWGWRIPFVLSAPLLLVSLWIRSRLHESPVFTKLKAEDATSRAPLAESFLRWSNMKWVLIALATVAGQAVVFYTATFYALYFLQRAARLDSLDTSLLLVIPLLIGAPLILFGGWISDKLGRKKILLTSYALSAALFFPLFSGLLSSANPSLARAQAASPIIVRVDPDQCSLQFDPVGRNTFNTTSCDIALSFLAGQGARYSIEPAPGASSAHIAIGGASLDAPDPRALNDEQKATAIAAFRDNGRALLTEHGYLGAPDAAPRDRIIAMAILVALLFLSALSTGPMNIVLAELFPSRIRYSSSALPQNLGNGWFGGFLPATAFAIVAATGDIYAGLWYPVIIAVLSFVICLLFLPETRGRPIE